MISEHSLSYPALYQTTTDPDETFCCLAKTTTLYDNVGVNLKNTEMICRLLVVHLILVETYHTKKLEIQICKVQYARTV